VNRVQILKLHLFISNTSYNTKDRMIVYPFKELFNSVTFKSLVVFRYSSFFFAIIMLKTIATIIATAAQIIMAAISPAVNVLPQVFPASKRTINELPSNCCLTF